MIYLTGVTNDRDEGWLIPSGFGLMIQPGNSYHLRVDRFRWWAADNGCFADSWTEESWAPWLESLPTDGCLFAVAPDVYPDAAESLHRGLSFAPEMRSLGFPVAVVAQDGAERLSWPWDDLDCLFIGGEMRKPGWKEWKESDAAARLAQEARRAGKWVHMGRVNTRRRLVRAEQMGCNSADGTYLKWAKRKRAGEDGLVMRGRELESWVNFANYHPTFFTAGHEAPSHRIDAARHPGSY